MALKRDVRGCCRKREQSCSSYRTTRQVRPFAITGFVFALRRAHRSHRSSSSATSAQGARHRDTNGRRRTSHYLFSALRPPRRSPRHHRRSYLPRPRRSRSFADGRAEIGDATDGGVWTRRGFRLYTRVMTFSTLHPFLIFRTSGQRRHRMRRKSHSLTGLDRLGEEEGRDGRRKGRSGWRSLKRISIFRYRSCAQLSMFGTADEGWSERTLVSGLGEGLRRVRQDVNVRR